MEEDEEQVELTIAHQIIDPDNEEVLVLKKGQSAKQAKSPDNSALDPALQKSLREGFAQFDTGAPSPTVSPRA